jgi:glycogen debranching enzyme
MDFSHNVVLKEHYTFFVGDAAGHARGGEHGLYNRDTRLLSRYAWRLLPAGHGAFQTLVATSPRPDVFHGHDALIEGPSQLLAVRRRLVVHADGLHDELEVSNTSMERQSLSLELEVDADFVDLFEARGWHRHDREAPDIDVGERVVALSHNARDGVRQAVSILVDDLAAARPDGADWELSLAPGEHVSLRVRVRIDNPLDDAPHEPIDYAAWRAGFRSLPPAPDDRVLARAIDDLRGLLLFTPEGPVPAAGIPWFVAAFGRDALLTSHMLLPYRPDVAEGTLRYLAAHQGSRVDAFRAEAPGKILHEVRFGELSRLGTVPHARYFGTVDATPLFLMLLEAHRNAVGDDALVRALRPAWEAALAWLTEHGDIDGDGFVEFTPAAAGVGLTVQSWKDSGDSMSHADGELAEGALAVSEVQGYTYAAFRAAAQWYRALGEPGAAQVWDARATALQARFHEAFWLDDLDTYAMALDGGKRPLRVRNSDAGQLLWTGIVPRSHAPRLVRSLLSSATWSGWGLRTLGEGERRYNPVSYHNGSVWPHDTALFAAGLAAYGFTDEAAAIREALYALAAAQIDLRLPELVAGYARDDERPPVPYPVACRPQAWDAAALVFLLGLDAASAELA